MADTPSSNASPLPTPNSPSRQLFEEPERDNLPSLITTPVATSVTPGEPIESPPSAAETPGSESTSSDKLSALPSLLRSSPAGRSAVGPRADSKLKEGLENPSTTEARFIQTSAPRAPQISHGSSDGVVEGTPPRQRVSFDSERGSSTSPRPIDRPLPTASEPILPSTQGATFSSFVARAHDSVHGRLHHGSYRQGHSRRPSQGRRNSAESHTRTRSRTGSPTRSPSPSRGVIPLRSFLGRLSPLGRTQSREEPFIAINPFRPHPSLSLNLFSRCFGTRSRRPDVEAVPYESQSDISCTCACVPLFGSTRFHNAHILAFDTLPRQLYLHSQLRLPSLYFSRVARIFEDAAVSRPEIQRIIDACEPVNAENMTGNVVLPFPEEWVPPNVSPALARFKRSWEGFVDSLIREWKTLNVLSALLLSAILTIFQIQDAENDPLTRTAALCSLISALMSLSYGIMYIVRFGNMGSMYRASRWAEDAQRTETAIFWNVWVLLALPGVWLAWSVLAFVVAIMSFVWRSGARGQSQTPLPQGQELGARIGITCQLLLGLVYFVLVIRTFSSYGESARKARIVRRLADGQIELETRGEWRREGERDNARAQARESQEGTRRDRGRSRATDSMRQKEKPPVNELGLSGMDRKQEVVAPGNGDVSINESYSSLGM
ncbi:hypothetical protein BJV74DRAFT_840524 [Russula compacta]|nr:hypothetical protein BJV74DRAFT_840524 [Russula compacta]